MTAAASQRILITGAVGNMGEQPDPPPGPAAGGPGRAGRLIAQFGPADPAELLHPLVGGKFCFVPLGERMS